MPDSSAKIVRAWLDSTTSGIVEFEQNWAADAPPRLVLGAGAPALAGTEPAPDSAAGREFGYVVDAKGKTLSFVLPLGPACDVDPSVDDVFVAGDFSGWQAAAGKPEWQLVPSVIDGEAALVWSGPAEPLLKSAHRFKFVTGQQIWLGVPDDVPNLAPDEGGIRNRLLDPARTGRHLWRFAVDRPFDLSDSWSVALENSGGPVALGMGTFFRNLKTSLPLGAIPDGGVTVFRLFAPRARKATLYLAETPESAAQAFAYDVHRRLDGEGAAGVWEIVLDRNLHGWLYWYTLDGVREGPGAFDPEARVLDPYALAAVDRGGPGIILSRDWVGQGDREFQTPAWQDLVIAEAHVRDLAANAPVSANPAERMGFTGLAKWVEHPDFYLHGLGVNCVELQPVQQFDNKTVEEYHWGYMTNNFFSPESGYSLSPAEASGVHELQDLVSAFHKRGMAVILDVVYNHVGVPAHLIRIDGLYYFQRDLRGALTNWSGCGNDLRADSAMARRLIIDSCTHLIEAYGADGFRFDLAELLGVGVLREIAVALRRVKPDVILIAEPWSFRGHIAGALRDTNWSSWNDGYRDFLRDYVRGQGPSKRLEYFLRGSPWYFAKWPAQTVNYTESHDDRAWLDMITENAQFDGSEPTMNDRRRTHLMAAVLFMSLGIPMISAGQDFLRSKRGLKNTYERGDVNALDYQRLYRYLGTHAYFAEWIDFRRGFLGQLVRRYSRPTEGFFQFFGAPDSAPLAALYNADRSDGPVRLLFAINPTLGDATIAVGKAVADLGHWRQLADHERFYVPGHGSLRPVEANLILPPLSCGLWMCEG
jgi:pullulanase/glycogen debranching enzyme